MRSRLSLLVLAVAGIALGAPGAMSGTASPAVAPAAEAAAATTVAGSPVGISVWLFAGALGIAVCAVALRRRPVAPAGRPVAAPVTVDTPAEPTLPTNPPGVAAPMAGPAEPEAVPDAPVESGHSTGTPSRQPAAV